MVVYIFTTGASTLTWDFLTSDYTIHTVSLHSPEDFEIGNETFENTSNSDYFSEYIIYFGIIALANYPQLYTYLDLDKNDFIFTQEELYDISNSRICKFIYLKNNKKLINISKSLINAWEASNIDKVIPLENILNK